MGFGKRCRVRSGLFLSYRSASRGADLPFLCFCCKLALHIRFSSLVYEIGSFNMKFVGWKGLIEKMVRKRSIYRVPARKGSTAQV